jgi:choline-sulfatase
VIEGNEIQRYVDRIEVGVATVPAGRQWILPRLFNPVRRTFLRDAERRVPLRLTAEVDCWKLDLPEKGLPEQGTQAAPRPPLTLVIETEGAPQWDIPVGVELASDGVITLPAHRALVNGELLRYEPQPSKNTVGYWTRAEDWCEWRLDGAPPGRYHVEILQGCGKGQGGSEVQVRLGTQRLGFQVEETGHFQNFVMRRLGEVEISDEPTPRLALQVVRLAAAAAMDVRLVRLVPVDHAPRPNVVLLLTDDQSFETVGMLGMQRVATPNMDRLAERGRLFTHAYNMGSWSGAVCVASRTMLNTGRFLWTAENVYQDLEDQRLAGRLWSQLMAGAGYDTYMTGKWHLPADPQQSFAEVRHVRPGMPQDTEAGYNRPLPDQPDRWLPWDREQGGFWQGGTHWSEVVADDSIEFLEQAAKRERPFFMYLAFNAPHDPRQAPREYVERYPTEQVEVPSNFQRLYPFAEAIGCGKTLRDERLAPFPRTEHAIRVHRREYFAAITHLDAQIGRILDALQATGKADDTYVFFTSDHGLAVGHHGLVGKQNMYDHSVRVPLVVAGPGVSAGVCNSSVYLQDLMPTALELAAAGRPEQVQFASLTPALRGAPHQPYDRVYGAYLRLQRMIISGGYKLIAYPAAGRLRLYHLSEDPEETVDLADNAELRPLVRKLFGELVELQREMGDSLDLASSFPSWR